MNWKSLCRGTAAGMITVSVIAGTMAMSAAPASALMCMVDCWTEDGGWAGGDGLFDRNPNTGSDAGGSDDGRVGGGGYEGASPDGHAPSGNGWGDPRLPEDSSSPQPSAERAEVLTTDVDKLLDDFLDAGNLTEAIEALKEAQADRDDVFDDPDSTPAERDAAQQKVDSAEERVNHKMNDNDQESACAGKSSLPWC